MFLIVADVLRRALSFVTVLVIARKLGVEDFGRYSFVLSFVVLFAGLANFGLDTVLIRDVAREGRGLRNRYSATIWMKLATSSVTALLIAAVITLLDYPVETMRSVYLMAMASVFFALTDTATSLCTGTQRMGLTSVISVSRGILVITLLGATFLTLGTGLAQVFVAQLLAAILLLALALLVVGSRISTVAAPTGGPLYREILKQALPFVFIGGIYMAGYRVDVLMLSRLSGDVAVGIYSAAYTPIEIVLSLAQLLTQALFPALSQAFGASRHLLRGLATRSIKIFVVLALPMAVGLAVLAERVIQLLFSDEYALAASTLMVMGATVWIAFLQILIGWLVTASDRLRVLIWVNVLTLIAGIGMNFVLIPSFGATGAALSQAASSAIALTVLGWVAFREDFVDWRQLKFPRIVLATAVMGIATHFGRDLDLALLIPGAALLYGSLLWVSRAVDGPEIEELRRSLGLSVRT